MTQLIKKCNKRNAKLNPGEVAHIKALYFRGKCKWTQAELGRLFRVREETIWNIINNKTWKGV